MKFIALRNFVHNNVKIDGNEEYDSLVVKFNSKDIEFLAGQGKIVISPKPLVEFDEKVAIKEEMPMIEEVKVEEASVVEEVKVEEASVVEEAPVVEEALVVEEVPVIEVKKEEAPKSKKSKNRSR
jgi:hypothetical protein